MSDLDEKARQIEEDSVPDDPSRRSFLKTVGGAAVTVAAVSGATVELADLTDKPTAMERYYGRAPHYTDVRLTVNGEEHLLRNVPHQRTLLLALRDDLGLTGTKKSCNLGQCGACTVLMDGKPVYACFVLAKDADGHEILTVEGGDTDPTLHAVQEGFVAKMGSQCGMCTPGMIMSAVGLLKENPNPSYDEVKFGLSGVLCRCGNYPHEIASVLDAAKRLPATAALAAAARTEPGAEPIPAEAGLPGAFTAPSPDAEEAISPEDPPASRLNSTHPSLDAWAKATGRAHYTADLVHRLDPALGKPLYAKVARSPYPHARVASIDDHYARRLPGYRGMITYRDVPGYLPTRLGRREPAVGDRVFLTGHCRYVGDAVAAVVADDIYSAQEALNRLRIRYEQLPAEWNADEVLENDFGKLHGDPIAGFGGPQPKGKATVEFKQGDVEQGLKEADLVVEGTYVTPVQCTIPIEPHSTLAVWNGDELTLYDTQQSVHMAQETIADALHLPREKVRVVAEYVGGGFGGKCTDTTGKTLYQGIAAMLARKTGRPVLLEYTLKEELMAEDTRNPFTMHLRTGVKKNGRITAIYCKAIQNTGGYASSGPAVNGVAAEGIVNTYACPNFHYEGYSVYTNGPVGGEMRGFGHPQAVFCREVHMDEVATRLGMDPVRFRAINSKHTGDPLTMSVEKKGLTVANIAPVECLKLGAEAAEWSRWTPPEKKTGRIRRGVGVRFSQEHSGRGASNGIVWLDRDGKIHVPIGSGNIGTANHTAISLIVAEALGVPEDDLVVTWGGSSDTAWDFVTDASRSVHCHGKAMLNAALDLKRQLSGAGVGRLSVGEGGRKGFVTRVPVRTDFTPYYDPRLDISPLLDESTGEIEKHPTPQLNPPTLKMAKKILAEGGVVGLGYYIWNPAVQAWGASFAEVEVDMETGQVQVLKLVGAHDCGRVIHRTGAEAQVHGGMIMGLGYGATEELPLDPNNGMPVYQTLYEYRPPSILDMPTLVPILVEAPVESGPYGAKGLGENPMFDAAAPVVNAIYNATGVYVREIPVTPYRVYQALKEAGKLMTREA